MKCDEKLGKLIFLEEDLKENPHNHKSLNLDQDSRRNHRVNKIQISEIKNDEKPKLKLKLTKNYDSKLKSKAIRRKIRMKFDL